MFCCTQIDYYVWSCFVYSVPFLVTLISCCMTCALLLSRLVCDDISGGQENLPIPATNLVDDPPVPPTGMFHICVLAIHILVLH
jgi:hypothetical protein